MIDLRSDTVTKPTQAMREAMAKAMVGDDVFGDDPTMNDLESFAAELLGKEDACFVPSGTFSNQLALFTHCQQGDEVIVDQFAHIVQHESGASPIISGVQLFTLESDNGIWNVDKLKRMIKRRSLSTTQTKLLCIENAYSGRVLPLTYMKQIKQIADQYGLLVHLDGARIFNAAVNLGCDVSEIASFADSVSVCLSKGLAAPVGSLLVGSNEFIVKARRKRKMMGGGMRQVGILAAAGKIALEQMPHLLKRDHEHATYLASLLKEIPNVVVDEKMRDINMVFFDIEDERKYHLDRFLEEHGVKILPYEAGFRFVTHYEIAKNEIEKVIVLLKRFFS